MQPLRKSGSDQIPAVVGDFVSHLDRCCVFTEQVPQYDRAQLRSAAELAGKRSQGSAIVRENE